MSEKLQQAIAATRAGKTKDAQILLTQLLKEDKEDVHAWYLLSLLVESPEKKRAYLSRVLALDPSHAKARAQLAELDDDVVAETTAVFPADDDAEPYVVHEEQTVVSPPISHMDEDEPFEVNDELPSWLADSDSGMLVDEIFEEEAAEDFGDEDWLAALETPAPTVALEEPATQTAMTPISPEESQLAEDPKPQKTTAVVTNAENERATARLNQILALLSFGAFLILLLLIYMLFFS